MRAAGVDGRLIAGHCARLFFPGLSCAGFRVVFAVGTGPLHDGSSRGWDLPRWTTHFAASAVHPIKRDSPAHVPAGTSVGRSRVNALRQDWPQAAPPAVRSKSWPDRSMAGIEAAKAKGGGQGLVAANICDDVEKSLGDHTFRLKMERQSRITGPRVTCTG